MSVYVICMTSGGGVPIFSRRKGNNTENLPFATIAALNGVHLFSKSQKIDLLSTVTEDYCFAWETFNDCVVLIGIASGCIEPTLRQILNEIFKAMILIVGMDELRNQRNIDRLKRELKICYPVIDRILDALDYGDSNNRHCSDLIGMPETILCAESQQIRGILDSFTECLDSLFSCILIHGKIAAATDSWWTLDPIELKLLAVLAMTTNSNSSSTNPVPTDIPVFLPVKSPSVPFRYICCPLIPDVQLCCLCGPAPILEEIQHVATQTFKNVTDLLSGALHCHPRNYPITCAQLDEGILGFLLVQSTRTKYVICKNPHISHNFVTGKTAGTNHRLDILRTFFYQSICTLNGFLDGTDTSIDTANEQNNHVALETYWCSEYHKCYALKIGTTNPGDIFCILYQSTVPTHTMKLLAEKTYKILLNDKQYCW